MAMAMVEAGSEQPMNNAYKIGVMYWLPCASLSFLFLFFFFWSFFFHLFSSSFFLSFFPFFFLFFFIKINIAKCKP